MNTKENKYRIKTLKAILNKLNLDKYFQKLVLQKIEIPVLDTYNPVWEYWYPHPPCLIPLFLGYGAEYSGLVCHFFSQRKPLFVEYILEQGHFRETASNEKQFITLMLLEMLETEEEPTKEIRRFCRAVNYGSEDLQKVFTYWDEYSCGKEHTSPLVYFSEKETVSPYGNIERSEYDGDFPASMLHSKAEDYSNACSFEIGEIDCIENPQNLPAWFKENINLKELFHQYLSQNKPKEAWLTLNSKGWLLKDVAEALTLLKDKTDSELFHLIADNWIYGWEHSDCDEEEKY